MSDIYEDKICVVTGAGAGIGRAIALDLASRGARLALSDIDADGVEETRRLIGTSENRLIVDQLDVADAEGVAAYPALVEAALGPADCLFNVAGLTRVGVFEQTPLSAVEKIMDVNFWGVVRLSKAFLPHLRARRGRLVNISSIFGVIGFGGQAHYCASKFAVRGFSEALAEELRDIGVSVTSVHPGGVDTAIARNAEIDAMPEGIESPEALHARFKKAARTTPEDAARTILEGVARRKRRVMIGADARIISSLQRLLPSSYHAVLRFLVRDAPKFSSH